MAVAKEKGDSSKQMVVTMKATLRITSPMATESISILVDTNTRVSGRVMFPMEEGKLSIPMKASITDPSSTIENMEREFLCKKDVSSKEIS
jgi:hypothetical protein